MKITSRNVYAFLALFIARSVLAQVDVDAQIQRGDAALKAFKLPQALDAYREAYRLAPDNYAAAWKVTRALADTATMTSDVATKKQLIAEAETAARKAVKLKPRDSAGHTSLSIAVGQLALLEGGRRKVELSKEVKDESTLAVQLNPRDDIAYHVLAVWNREMTQLNWVLRKVAELFYGKFPPASLDNANAFLKRAIEISPENVAHHVELGITLATAEQYKQAETELAHALALPQSWATDSRYRAKAEAALKDIAPHLK